jgi:hypothetical protein
MPVMTVNSLAFVREAYESWGIISDFDTLSDPMYVRGLSYLNQILAKDQANGISIPAYAQLNFNLIAGQAFYEISNNIGAEVASNPLMDLEDGVILYSNLIQYPILDVKRSELLGIPLAVNTQSWPSQMLLYKFKRITGDRDAPIVTMSDDPNSCVLRFYPVPSQTFPVIIYAKRVLDSVEKNQDISIPPHMLMYLRYSLGQELTRKYENSVWKPEDTQTLIELREMFKSGNEIDNSLDQSPTLQSGAPSRPMATNVPYY